MDRVLSLLWGPVDVIWYSASMARPGHRVYPYAVPLALGHLPLGPGPAVIPRHPVRPMVFFECYCHGVKKN